MSKLIKITKEVATTLAGELKSKASDLSIRNFRGFTGYVVFMDNASNNDLQALAFEQFCTDIAANIVQSLADRLDPELTPIAQAIVDAAIGAQKCKVERCVMGIGHRATRHLDVYGRSFLDTDDEVTHTGEVPK